jgi:hypothetical protein
MGLWTLCTTVVNIPSRDRRLLVFIVFKVYVFSQKIKDLVKELFWLTEVKGLEIGLNLLFSVSTMVEKTRSHGLSNCHLFIGSSRHSSERAHRSWNHSSSR